MAMLHRNESLQEFFKVEHAKQQTQNNSTPQEQEFNRRYDSTHRLGGVLRLRPRSKSTSVHDQWELPYNQNKLLLVFYLLIHLFYANDNVLDTTEQKAVRKLYRRSRNILYPSHFEQILTYTKNQISLGDVHRYISEKNLSAKMRQEAMQEIKALLQRKSGYREPLLALEKTLK